MALDDKSDPTHFWRDQDLIFDLRKASDPLSLKAAERLAWLREHLIDPVEYMRVSNERGALLMAMMKTAA